MEFEKLMKEMETKGLINLSSWNNIFDLKNTSNNARDDEGCNKTSSPESSFVKKPSPLKLEGNLSENWKKFIRAFENFLVMSEEDDKDDSIKIGILKDHIGESGLNLLNSLNVSKTDLRKFSVVISKLEEYCCGCKNIVLERFKLLKTRQAEGESFDEFLVTLASRIQNCKYGSQEASILRDLIIVGLRDTGMQEQLLRKTNITLYNTVKFLAEKAQMRKNQLFPEESVMKSMNIIESFLENDHPFTNENQNFVTSTTNNATNPRVLSNLENKGPTLNASFIRQPSPLQLKGNLPENWTKFKRDFENFLIMIEKDAAEDRRKIAFLETYIGESGLELIDSFNLNKVDKGKYDLILGKLEEFCNRCNNIVRKRFEFLSTCQKEDESFDDFLTNLKLKISSCEYGDEEDSILRDLIIFGLRDIDTQESLLEQPNITLKGTVKYVKAAEESMRSYLEKVLEKKRTRESVSNQNSTAQNSRASSPQISEISSSQINQVSSSHVSRVSSPPTSQVSSPSMSLVSSSHVSPVQVKLTSGASSPESTISQKPRTPPSPSESKSFPIFQHNVADLVVPKEPNTSSQNVKVIEKTLVQNGPSVSSDRGQLLIQKQSVVAASGTSYELARICNSLSQQQQPPSATHNVYNTHNTHNTYNTYNTTPKNEYTSPYSSSFNAITPCNTFGSVCSYRGFQDFTPDRPRYTAAVSRSNAWNESEPVTALRGIGNAYGSRLEAMGYRSVDDLSDKFESLGSDGFNRWLRNKVGVKSDCAAKCTSNISSRR